MPSDSPLANRLAKVQRHLRKWARRTDVTCWRVYEKDLPDHPLIVDWYDGDAVVWTMRRTRDETPAAEEAFVASALDAVAQGLEVPADRIHVKRRERQKDRQSGEGQYTRLAERGVVRVVRERDLSFEVNLSDYLDTGLFLDHRETRRLVRAECAGADVLNLFAYTASFTVAAIAGGARTTTTVDLSNTYLDWAARNLTLNGTTPADRHRLVRADALRFLFEAPASPRRYSRIVCDPPTFSNSKGMDHDFVVERDHPSLIRACHALLEAGGILWFSTNQRGFELSTDGLDGLAIREITAATLPEDFKDRRPHRCWRMQRRD